MPQGEMFDDFEEQGQNLLGSLHLDAEDEPMRRGAASRANSVRFDESALQGSSWAQNGRQSGDFGPIRPGSGLGTHGMMERSMSHKSDGRHSSAGHSVHSIHSHHSVASGRGSSLGLDTTFTPGGQEEDSPVGIPEPPPSFFILGSVPSIIRCWLTPSFSHDTLLYADICTGSQKSVVEYSLIKELDLVDDIHRDLDGVSRIRLHVYLTEATASHSNSRATPQMPSLGCTFEVAGMDQPEMADAKKVIRIFIGSETLREHSADILFSQNRMTLYSSEREKLSIPFVRPEDQGTFKNIRTMFIYAEKPKLNATARPFVLGESKTQLTNKSPESVQAKISRDEQELAEVSTPISEQASQLAGTGDTSVVSESSGENERFPKENGVSEQVGSKDRDIQSQAADAAGDGTRHASGAGSIWNSWRGAAANGTDQKEGGLLSGYQPAGRGRNMKVLKPLKSASSSSTRTGAAYEPAPAPRSSGELRRKSQTTADGGTSSTVRWEAKRTSIGALDTKAVPINREVRSVSSTPRTSNNPVGGASAFSWMTPSNKARTSTTAAE